MHSCRFTTQTAAELYDKESRDKRNMIVAENNFDKEFVHSELFELFFVHSEQFVQLAAS